MKSLKFALVSTFAAAALLPGIAGHAGTTTVVYGGVGSSAMFNAFATAAHSLAGGSNNYTAKNAAFVHDTSQAGIPDQKGNLWLIWSNLDGSGNRKVWYYLSVDSTVGVRSFFNSATLLLASPLPTAGQLVPGLPVDTAPASIPADVTTAVSGNTFNSGMTDITAADALVATKLQTTLGYDFSTNPIKSAVSTSVAYVVPFDLTSRSFVTTSIGAAPVVVFVNKSLTTTGNLGATTVKNIDRFVLAGFLNGDFHRSADIDTSITLPSLNNKNVATFIREGLSGTYNTMEYCIPNSVEVGSTQEKNVSTNPLNDANWAANAFTAAGRVRAIGTGELVGTVNSTANALGYAFWSKGNFASATSTKYITVDGVDPLNSSYGTGSYPTTAPAFTNVLNGGYPVWSLLRILTQGTPSTDITSLINKVATLTGNTDFVPAKSLKVFRSHRTTADVAVAHNGNIAGLAESGADAGGAVFTKNADIDFYNDSGMTTELTGIRQ